MRSTIVHAAVAALWVTVLPARAETLAELEQAARGNAAAVRIAQEEARARQYRVDAAQAQRGAQFSAGVGLADTREPVTDSVVRDYRRGSAQVGVRWPLLEGAQAQDRARTDARGALEAARLRARQAEIDVLRGVRTAYVDHLQAQQRLGLAEALLALEPGTAARLSERTRAALLLDAERRELQSIFETARRDAVRARAQRDDAQRVLRRLSALPQAVPALDAPQWELGCVTGSALLAGADERPAVALAAIELATREALADQQQWNGVDAGVSLTQSLTHDLGASSGRSTGVSVDISVPLGWRALRDARLAEAQSAVRRARLELDAARENDAANADRALRELQVRGSDRAAARQRLDAAAEALRVAERRSATLDGDAIEKVLRARYGVYVAALDLGEATQRLQRAQAELLDYAAPCAPADAPKAEPALDEGAAPAALLSAPLLSTPLLSAPLSVESTASHPSLGWFVWDSRPWLVSPDELLAQLPAGSTRVLVGFDAAQLAALATPAGAQRLRALHAAARARSVRIELLLGDPQWVLPAGRQQLLEQLAPITALPFDALVLDLERSQLPPRERRLWDDGVVATLAAVHAAVPWPIALTTHDRDLANTSFVRRLRGAGVDELLPMIYVADPARAGARWRVVQRAASASGLRVGLALSVERELPAASSLHRLGRAAALSRVAELTRSVGAAASADAPSEAHEARAPSARFGGVVIQSFEEFRRASP